MDPLPRTALTFRPLDSALVRYAEDAALWHERLLLLQWGGASEAAYMGWVICATPDRDVYTMRFHDAGRFREPCVQLVRDQLPAARQRCYLAEDGEGDFGLREIEELREEARRLRARERQEAGLSAEPGIFSEPPDGFEWIVLSDGGGMKKGQRHDGSGVEWLQRDTGIVRVAASGAAAVREEASVVLVQLRPRRDTADGERRLGPTSSEEEDVRILPVAFERGGERWRRLDEAAVLMSEVAMDDFPLEGPRSTLWLVKQLQRGGLDFRLHHERWAKVSGIRQNDRAIFEHRTLCRSLDLSISYDQLCVSNLASVETLVRRMVTIEEAYRGRPDAPNYEHAEYMSGVVEQADGSMVPPALKKHTADRLKSDAEILKELRKAKETRDSKK